MEPKLNPSYNHTYKLYSVFYSTFGYHDLKKKVKLKSLLGKYLSRTLQYFILREFLFFSHHLQPFFFLRHSPSYGTYEKKHNSIMPGHNKKIIQQLPATPSGS